jgi:hypothetical protein
MLRNILILIGTLAAGTAIGYYMAPTKIKTEVKIVEKEKQVVEQSTREILKFDTRTGKVREQIKETGVKTSTTNTQKSARTSERTQAKKTYAVKVGFAANPRANLDSVVRVGGEINLHLFNLWAGAEVDLSPKRPEFAPYLRMEF